MTPEELKSRTKRFALRVFRLVDALPHTPAGVAVAKQLVRSGSSVGANYRAARRARSKAEFRSMLSIVIEETDESAYRMELIIEGELMTNSQVEPLVSEANEIPAIMVASRKTSE